MKRLLTAILLLSSALLAQNALFPMPPITTVTTIGNKTVVSPVPNATITVCTSSGTGLPCSPHATIYADASGTSTYSNPFVTDSYGNLPNVYLPAGTYVVSVQGSGITTTNYTVPVGMPCDGGGNCSAKSIEQVRYADQFSGADCGAKIMAADADLGASPGMIVVNPACGVISTQIVLANSNRVLYFAPGNYTLSYAGTNPDQYTVSSPIHITASNVSVIGLNRATTTLNYTASPQSVGIDTLPAGCTVADGCANQQSNIVIAGLTLNGNQSSGNWPATDTNGDGISLQAGCVDCSVHDTSIHDWTYQGIVNTGAQATSYGVSITRNVVYNVGEYGIGLESYTRDSLVAHNIVGPTITTKVAGGGTGIYLASLAAPNGSNQNNDSNSVTDNQINGALAVGIVVQSGARWPKLTDNIITSPGRQCINVAGTGTEPAPAYVLIANNSCYNAGSGADGAIQAVGVDASHEITGLSINGNLVQGTQGTGILVGYATSPTVTGNHIDGAGSGVGATQKDGIGVSNASAAVITGNTAAGAAGYGVNVGSGTTDALVSSNGIAGNTAGAYIDSGTRSIVWLNKENTTDTKFHLTGVLASQLQLANNVAVSGDNGSGSQCRLAGYLGASPHVGDVDGCATDSYIDAASGGTLHLHFGSSDALTVTNSGPSLPTGKTADLSAGTTVLGSSSIASGKTLTNNGTISGGTVNPTTLQQGGVNAALQGVDINSSNQVTATHSAALNGATAVAAAGRFKLADQGQCTMASGTCTAQSLGSTYTAAPICIVTWTGTGTLAGIIKVSSTTSTVTPSSTTGTDTAQVNWACFGN